MADNKKPSILDFGEEEKGNSIIKVIGVGGGGGNAVNHMYRDGRHDVTSVLCNTDTRHETTRQFLCICNWERKDSVLATSQNVHGRLPRRRSMTLKTCSAMEPRWRSSLPAWVVAQVLVPLL